MPEPSRTAAATAAVQLHAAERAIDDPAKLAKAARIVRLALERRVITEAELRGEAGGPNAAA